MSFKVILSSKDESFTVSRNESILDAALRQGIALPYGCRGGSCGSCRGKLITGDMHYPLGPPLALSAGEQAAGEILLCQAHAESDLLIEMQDLDAISDIVVKTLPCRAISLQKLADDVMRLYLKLPTTEQLSFLAGQYIDIILRDGRRRSFSLANPPHADDYLELHIRKVPGGRFTEFVFSELKEKAIMRLQGPLGAFFLREDSPRPIILIAGGTGFAPIKAILEDAFYKNINRPIHLYWGARRRPDLYQHELPEQWIEKHAHFHYTPVLSDLLEGDHWAGRSGWVHEAVATDYADLSAYDVYMSGPPPMIDAAKETFFRQGLPADQLFYDSFDYALDSQGFNQS